MKPASMLSSSELKSLGQLKGQQEDLERVLERDCNIRTTLTVFRKGACTPFTEIFIEGEASWFKELLERRLEELKEKERKILE